MLHVHRAERSDRLVTALADLLADPLADPFAAEVVAVPSRGIERWLAQRLSHRLGVSAGRQDGVCAHVGFGSPAQLVDRAVGTSDDDPWEPDRLTWPLLEVIDECAGEAWCAALGAYLGAHGGDGTRAGRRFSAARHLAGLFTAYGEHRPEIVRAWGRKDHTGTPDDLAWQAELWRRLRDRVGVVSPAEELEDACAHLRAEPGSTDLPPRLSVFGPTRLSASHLQVLAALAAHRDVHLWLAHPSPALWERVRPHTPSTPGPVRRADDTTADAPHHPLLASLARDVRELQVRLAALGVPTEHHHHEVLASPTTLLGRLQRDLREDRGPGTTDGGALVAVDDDTLRVHACHGPDRQVEVLREVVLGLLEADPTLEPRDVVVMCPDIETFAPLITASFGLTDDDAVDHPGHRLPVRLADRALRQLNPLLATVATLLDLADARVTASQLLDLAESAPVRRRFRFDDDDLERLRELVHAAGVRWGLDAEHRAPFKLAPYAENSWASGLDRLLLGVAMSEDEQDWLDSALPLDEVDSGDVDRVGRLGEFVARVTTTLDGLRGEHPLEHWTATLQFGLDALTATTPADAWQLGQARAELADVLATSLNGPAPLRSVSGDGSLRLGLHDVRAVLADRLAGRPTRTNFRTGALTAATLTPMRSVPHRVVCLLGLDDQVFPRDTRDDGDDVLARDPLVGERDPASEDRQLLLDAIAAATEHLVVVHSGADERTNAPRPPAVPIGELLDTLDETVPFADSRPAREHVVVRHPLQPFDPRNFTAGGLRTSGPFSFDRAALTGARALTAERAPRPEFLPAPLPAVPRSEIALEDLARFLGHPVKEFLRQRLGLVVRADEAEPDEGLPVEPDKLAEWHIGDRLLRDRLAGHEVGACIEAETRRGALPPGALGQRLVRHLGRTVEPLVAASAPLRSVEATDADATVDLDDGVRVVGSVPGLRGDTLLTVTYSSLGPKHRLRAWVQLLALTAAHPDRSWTAVTLGRGRDGMQRSTLGPVGPDLARATLRDLTDLHRAGLAEPLPLMTKTSEAYANARRTGCEVGQAIGRARGRWTSRWGGEQSDAAHVRVWGRGRRLGDLLHGPGGDTDTERSGAGPSSEEPSRFGALAVRLWRPLRDAERLDTP